jgi:hypothetical protein
VIADADGVAFLPAHRPAAVIAAAERIAEKERRMAAEIRPGTSITVVMDPGYEQMLGTSWRPGEDASAMAGDPGRVAAVGTNESS